MLNPVVVLKAVSVAAATAAIVFLTPDRLRRRWHTVFHESCGPAGTGLGLIVGMWMLGVRSSGRFVGDQERLAFIVLPLITLVECMLASMRATRRWTVLLRVIVAFSVCPILLYGSVYLSGTSSVGQHAWNPADTVFMLGGVGAAIASTLLAITEGGQKTTSSVQFCCLGLTAAAGGVTTMLSGYVTGGLLAFPIAAVMMVACGVSFVRPLSPGVSSVGFVVVAGILVIGHFFGSLSAALASALLVVPLVCWLVNLVPAERFRPWHRGLLSLGMTTLLLACVVWQAQRSFQSAYTTSRPDAVESTGLQDYLDFGQ